MSDIKWGRVLLGGLLAGLLSNVLGIGSAHFLFAEHIKALIERLHLTFGPGVALLHVSMRLAFGVGVVWLYAAIRPRFGAGPRTAMVAGLAMWLFTFVFSFAGILPYDLYPARTLAYAAIWTFFETQACALVGGWVYRE